MQTVSTVWQDNRPNYISVPNIDKRTIYRVYLKCFDRLQGRVPHTKRRKTVYINVCPQTVLDAQLSNLLTSVFYVFICGRHVGTLKLMVHSGPNENEVTSHQCISVPFKTFAAALESLKGCDAQWLNMYMRALIQVENILSICCELWLYLQQ